jgi:hypothetical protein
MQRPTTHNWTCMASLVSRTFTDSVVPLLGYLRWVARPAVADDCAVMVSDNDHWLVDDCVLTVQGLSV